MGFSLWLKPVLTVGFNWIGQNFASPDFLGKFDIVVAIVLSNST